MPSDNAGNEPQSLPAEETQEPKLPAELTQLLESLPEEKRALVATVVRQRITTMFDGPLPPPSVLAEYEKVVPGMAERIAKMAESEGTLRAQAQRSSARKDIFAISCATIVQLGFFGTAAWALYLGHELVAVPLGLGGVIGLLFQRFWPFSKNGTNRDQN